MTDTEQFPWQDDALCREVDGDLFFPTEGREHLAEAKRLCAGCPVRTQCLTFALEGNERFGVWGGLSTKERDALKVAARRAS